VVNRAPAPAGSKFPAICSGCKKTWRPASKLFSHVDKLFSKMNLGYTQGLRNAWHGILAEHLGLALANKQGERQCSAVAAGPAFNSQFLAWYRKSFEQLARCPSGHPDGPTLSWSLSPSPGELAWHVSA